MVYKILLIISLVVLIGCSHNALIFGSEAIERCTPVCESYNMTMDVEGTSISKYTIECSCSLPRILREKK